LEALTAAGVIRVTQPDTVEGQTTEDKLLQALSIVTVALAGQTPPSGLRLQTAREIMAHAVSVFHQMRHDRQTAIESLLAEHGDIQGITNWLEGQGFKREAEVGDGRKVWLLTSSSYIRHVVSTLQAELNAAKEKATPSPYTQIGFVSEYGLGQLAQGNQEMISLLPGAKRHVPVFTHNEHPVKALSYAYNWSQPMTSENATAIVNALLFDLAHRFELLPDLKVNHVTGAAWSKLGALVNAKMTYQEVPHDIVLVPAYKPGTPLLEIVRGGICRDFENKQIITEALASGFRIDDSLVDYCRQKFNEDLDASMQKANEAEGQDQDPEDDVQWVKDNT
jgi:hypothetical protein